MFCKILWDLGSCIFLSYATVQYLDSLSEAGCVVFSSEDRRGNVCH